jgi:hypothetical protein
MSGGQGRDSSHNEERELKTVRWRNLRILLPFSWDPDPTAGLLLADLKLQGHLLKIKNNFAFPDLNFRIK